MAAEGALSFSVASMVEDVLQQHGIQSRELDLDSRRAEEAATRRYEAAEWLGKMVGVVGEKDLPAEPFEKEFRLGLRSGLILCNVLSKVQPGVVPKVVESPWDSALIPDGAALSANQYFENVRNFLIAAQELGLPIFEASDLEQGGKSVRVVICVLALKSYSDWKQTGANGVWKFRRNIKTLTSGKHFMRKNSEPFKGSLTRNLSMGEKSLNAITADLNSNSKCSSSLSMLVRAILLDKKPEEAPTVEEKSFMRVKKEKCFHRNHVPEKESEKQFPKQKMIFEQQNRDIIEQKQTLHTTKAGMQFMQMKFHEDIHNLGLHIHNLAYAASRYHKVLEENRKLYNHVQDLKGNFTSFLKV